MEGWEVMVDSGSADLDAQTIEAYRRHAAASGMQITVEPSPRGGWRVIATRDPTERPVVATRLVAVGEPD